MADPRNRLRPLLHCGVPHKVNAALDEIVRLGDPALCDWILEGAYVADLAMSSAWTWKHGDVQELRHPSLEPEQVLRIAARGTSPLAATLRAKLAKLGVELGFNRRAEPFLDVAMLGGLTDTTKLRLMPKDPENLYEWRAELAKTPPKLLGGFDMIAGMAALEHLTVLGGGGVTLAPLVSLRALAHVELVACDLRDTAELGRLAARTLILVACPHIATLDALPPALEHLHLEDLPALRSLAGLATAPKLRTVHVAGVPLDALPALPKSVRVTFQPERPERTDFAELR